LSQGLTIKFVDKQILHQAICGMIHVFSSQISRSVNRK
jgi:hypothetical protein